MSAMEFNLFLPQMRLSFDQLVERARAAEAAGFVGITGMDHLVPPMADDQPMFEAIVTTTWLAAHTERLRVGSLVLCDAFRHPAVLARQAVSIDHAVGRPLRARHRMGLGARGARDVRHRLDRGRATGSSGCARRWRCSGRSGRARPSTTTASYHQLSRRTAGAAPARPHPDRHRRDRSQDARARARLRRLVERAHRPAPQDRRAAAAGRRRARVDPADGRDRSRAAATGRDHRASRSDGSASRAR